QIEDHYGLQWGPTRVGPLFQREIAMYSLVLATALTAGTAAPDCCWPGWCAPCWCPPAPCCWCPPPCCAPCCTPCCWPCCTPCCPPCWPCCSPCNYCCAPAPVYYLSPPHYWWGPVIPGGSDCLAGASYGPASYDWVGLEDPAPTIPMRFCGKVEVLAPR